MSSECPIIVALDVPAKADALAWVKRLQPEVDIVKVGMQLFYRYGPDIVREIQDQGVQVFLDLKLHDIPNTVAHACESVVDLGVRFLTVHASGGESMLKAAMSVMHGTSTQLLGVTVLTSMDEGEMSRVFPGQAVLSPEAWVLKLAGLAESVGLHGLVCSAQENIAIRGVVGNRMLLVNPGIRPVGVSVQDQKRVQTPQEAMRNGANYLVMGRPVLEAPDPVAMLQSIRKELTYAAGLPT